MLNRYFVKFAPTIFFIVIFFILLKLGFWQIDRYQEKKAINLSLQQAIARPYVKLGDNNLSNIFATDYLHVKIKGQFLTEYQFIYDNQTYNQIAGYSVFIPFLIESSSRVILVNMGWSQWPQGQRKSTLLEVLPQKMSIRGITSPILKRLVLNDGKKIMNKFPLLVQSINVEQFGKITGLNFVDRLLHLKNPNISRLKYVWQPTYGSPNKHLAYAVQWFGMALVLLVIVACLVKKKYFVRK